MPKRFLTSDGYLFEHTIEGWYDGDSLYPLGPNGEPWNTLDDIPVPGVYVPDYVKGPLNSAQRTVILLEYRNEDPADHMPSGHQGS